DETERRDADTKQQQGSGFRSFMAVGRATGLLSVGSPAIVYAVRDKHRTRLGAGIGDKRDMRRKFTAVCIIREERHEARKRESDGRVPRAGGSVLGDEISKSIHGEWTLPAMQRITRGRRSHGAVVSKVFTT